VVPRRRGRGPHVGTGHIHSEALMSEALAQGPRPRRAAAGRHSLRKADSDKAAAAGAGTPRLTGRASSVPGNASAAIQVNFKLGVPGRPIMDGGPESERSDACPTRRRAAGPGSLAVTAGATVTADGGSGSGRWPRPAGPAVPVGRPTL
jgi:hypothetical protein